ncbi:LEC14B protein [Mangifera indica]|uniref:LEC14B protein n=1 Tax=Mangifera indica TaxID=29780 RepID=UPI001CF934F2|nr:LEC14B protein [Mangifera indica]XP_044493892.1 LEC14B protein [Mangifera indica]XP_044493893.1 LEC14B protein [Mangifera indica]XP_044493894.1 LEC14B protein [Mangifera indica]XP_044493895.1 LEC14B protein [Mangifera indica]
MYVISGQVDIDEMGYSMSRLDIESDYFDSDESSSEASNSHSKCKNHLNNLDHEIAQLTKLKSGPHEKLSKVIPGKQDLPVSVVKMLASRQGNYSGRGRFSSADCCHILSRYLPVNGPWLVDQISSRAYVSQFSADGSLFIAGFQGSQIRIYNVERGWKLQKDIRAKSLRWTVTDTCLSPDQHHLVYASMSPIVHIVNVGSGPTKSCANITEIHDGLDFSAASDLGGYSFGIFSVKFSTDGRELVAGSSDDSIYVYDLEANKLSLKILAHTSDVNTVCFADESGHLIYSGSDDNLCKVWDRRCLNAKGKPAGILMGHLEGITYIDSRGDGRYFISNGKDQTTKLWDIRKMLSNTTCNVGLRNYEWDYRWMDYPPPARDLKHPSDQSVATYKGHSILRTLIRCYFSPAYSTGQKYIYTGSHDGCVYVYDLVSGAKVAVLRHHNSPVRDCSWHPYYPMLVSSSWDGDVVRWEFPGNGEAPIAMNKRRIRRRQFFL